MRAPLSSAGQGENRQDGKEPSEKNSALKVNE